MSVQEYGPAITLAEAQRMAEAAGAEALKQGLAVIIAVTDSASQLVLLHRMDHAQYGSIAIAQAKAKCAVDFKRPTKQFEEALVQGGMGWRALSVDGIAPFEGGLPVVKNGKIIGAIGVSGARSDQDGVIAAAGIAALE
ncbi:MAG: GlcG/HbpS family heme-binding protein [Povalibacter sp.]